MGKRLGVIGALLLSLDAGANSPITGFSCSPKMQTEADAATADVARRFGKEIAGTCSCFEEDCSFATATWKIPLEGTTKLSTSLMLSRSIGSSNGALPALLTAAGLRAYLKRLSGHPLIVALQSLAPATCVLTNNGVVLSATCTTALWQLELTEDEVRAGKKVTRSFFKGHFRLPLEALKTDPELKIARADPRVAKFLEGKSGVVAEYAPNSPRVLTLKSGVEPAAPFDVLKSKEALSVFFKIQNGGWADVTLSVEGVCGGQQYGSHCP